MFERQASDLEAAAHPALDALTGRVWQHGSDDCMIWTSPTSAQVTTQNLERVRRIKNRLVRLTTRVETVRLPHTVQTRSL